MNIVKFNYKHLKSLANCSREIESAFGHNGLGVCIVENIPEYVDHRQRLLPLINKLANLPKKTLLKLEKPEIKYSLGWSRGVEQFKGKFDTEKGSFYANPFDDTNIIWPKEKLPEIEFAFKNLGKILQNVVLCIAKHVDSYVENQCKGYEQGKMCRILNNNEGVVGRLLHYYPKDKKIEEDELEGDWCGWHNDHSALTALTSALFTNEKGEEIKIKNNKCGIFVKNRSSQIVKINIPEDSVAIQIGESAQILTGGIVRATPHCVMQGDLYGVSRSTCAIFFGPKNNEKMIVPYGIPRENAFNKSADNIPPIENRWFLEDNFAEFSERTIHAYSEFGKGY